MLTAWEDGCSSIDQKMGLSVQSIPREGEVETLDPLQELDLAYEVVKSESVAVTAVL